MDAPELLHLARQANPCLSPCGVSRQCATMQSPHSMMRASDAAYGERAATDADAAGLRTFARVLAEPAALHARAGQLQEHEALT